MSVSVSTLDLSTMEFVCGMRLMMITLHFHRRLMKSIRVSNSFGLCFHREPYSWIYQSRFLHVQSSTKSTANRVMHMPFFSMAHFMSENRFRRGLKLYSAQHLLTPLIILNGATDVSCYLQNSGNEASMQRFSQQNLPEFLGAIVQQR